MKYQKPRFKKLGLALSKAKGYCGNGSDTNLAPDTCGAGIGVQEGACGGGAIPYGGIPDCRNGGNAEGYTCSSGSVAQD